MIAVALLDGVRNTVRSGVLIGRAFNLPWWHWLSLNAMWLHVLDSIHNDLGELWLDFVNPWVLDRMLRARPDLDDRDPFL